MLAMDRGNRRLFQKIVASLAPVPEGNLNWEQRREENSAPEVEKKSNLDVLDKRGWNVVIYAIETQMLTDVGSLEKLNGVDSYSWTLLWNADAPRSIRC